MATWASHNKKLNSTSKNIQTNIFTGALLSHKSSGVDLMQNCDLPPPSKLFPGPNQTVTNSTYSLIETGTDFDVDSEKLELLKALRLSQTRAREAEKKAANLVTENEIICSGFMRESMQLLAYRNWVMFLEIEISKMQKQQEKNNCNENIDEKEIEGFSWFAALAICLGIAFSCRYWL